MNTPTNPTPAPAIDELRINALMAALQQQRDAALNQAVMLSADLASVRDELEKANARLAELTQTSAEPAMPPPPDEPAKEP